MKEFIKRNFVILLAFALPIAFIAAITFYTYLPSLFISTKYNFVYTACTDAANYYPYRCDNYLQRRYSVVGGGLAVNTAEPIIDPKGNPIEAGQSYTARIFLHDTEKNEGREITLEEAQTLKLNGLLTSPDGVTVSSNWDRGGDFFPFFGGGSSYGYYLTKGKSRSRLNLIQDDQYYYRDNFQFVGWVLPGRN